MGEGSNGDTMKKTRNPIAVALQKRGGSLAGLHGNKGRRGSGKGKGKASRHPKHKGRGYEN